MSMSERLKIIETVSFIFIVNVARYLWDESIQTCFLLIKSNDKMILKEFFPMCLLRF